jgi:hypothetical protein
VDAGLPVHTRAIEKRGESSPAHNTRGEPPAAVMPAALLVLEDN